MSSLPSPVILLLSFTALYFLFKLILSQHFFADLSQVMSISLHTATSLFAIRSYWFKAPSTVSVLPFLAIDGDEELHLSFGPAIA